jgi:hypothetical protein
MDTNLGFGLTSPFVPTIFSNHLFQPSVPTDEAGLHQLEIHHKKR